jgi:hypothetical protein
MIKKFVRFKKVIKVVKSGKRCKSVKGFYEEKKSGFFVNKK